MGMYKYNNNTTLDKSLKMTEFIYSICYIPFCDCDMNLMTTFHMYVVYCIKYDI